MIQVLIADDDFENRYLLRSLLEGHGYSVAEAQHGVEALELARQTPPQLVISDLLMPTMDGYALLRQWKADEALRRIPFMVYTATYTDPKDERLALNLGADAFLVKPIEPEALMAHVQRLLTQAEKTSHLPQSPQGSEYSRLEEYNEALLRKLEHKALGLEKANRELRTEIAERRRTEAELRDSEERYRKLFHAIHDPLFVCDRSTLAYLAVNDAAVTEYGYSQAEFLSMSLQNLMPAGDELLTSLSQLSSPPEPQSVWRHQKKNGEFIEVEISSSEIIFSGRQAYLIQVRNVTEQRHLEAKFRQAQKMEAIGRLVGGVAHDFNNLLTVINGYSDLLLSQLSPQDPMSQPLSEVQLAGEQAERLTRQLLAFSRQQLVELKLVHLNTVITNARMLLHRLIGEDILLVTHLSSHLGYIKADPSQVEQILMNLVVNARDAMPGGGSLTLETQMVRLDEDFCQGKTNLVPGNYITLRVSDTGIGMDLDTQAKIFEPFFTTKEIGKGTGLGLAMVHSIVEEMRGHHTVESVLGTGTTFTIYFPQAQEAAESAPQQVSFSAPSGTETILVVEDEDAVRSLECQILRRCGYQVLEAANGREALRLAARQKEPIHLLLSDVVMPHLGGRALAEHITAARPECKVLFLSGYTSDEVVRHGVFRARFEFLQKPFTFTALAQKVRQVLDI